MVAPESTGLDIALNIILNFIDILISDVGRVVIDSIMGGIFDSIMGYIFGGGMSVELAFSLVFSLILLGVFYKYIYAVVN
jgi:hypothetical protein